MVDLQAALEEHLLDVAVAERITQLPGDGLDDEGGLEVPALEVTAAARTVPDLWDAIRRASTRFTPKECRNYLKAAGYENDAAVATCSGTALIARNSAVPRPKPAI